MSPSLPLDGLRVLLTRPAEQAAAWAAALERAGARVLRYPTIDVTPPPSWEPLDEALRRLSEYHWIVFTSGAAARHTMSRMPPSLDVRHMTRPRVAAVGRETARVLAEHGVAVALVPEEQRQEGLAAALGELRPGTRVLFPQAIGGREELRNALLARGCMVDVVPASQTVPRRELPPLPACDVFTFASPSALRAFVAVHGLEPLRGTPLAVVGPTTGAAAEAFGLKPLVADAPTVEALIRVLSTVHPSSSRGVA